MGAIQKFITYDLLDEKGAKYVINVMWLLMENNIDEVKVLQTAALLLTTSNLVKGESLSKVKSFFLNTSSSPVLYLKLLNSV